MINRYEDTSEIERNIMTTMGYYWRGTGWQRDSDYGNTMVVTGWVGPTPSHAQNPSSIIIHMWDQRISDMNTRESGYGGMGEYDDWPGPISENYQNELRAESARKLNYLKDLVESIQKDIVEITKNINNTEDKRKETDDVLDHATLRLLINKLQVQKEKIINLKNEARKRYSQEEYSRIHDEFIFHNSRVGHSYHRHKKYEMAELLAQESEKENGIIREVELQNFKIKQAEDRLKEEESEFNQVKDAVKFTADFYKEIFTAFGEKAEKLSRLLETQIKGTKIKNAVDAAKTYDKYRHNINKKISVEDRAAIAKYLESIDVKVAENNFKLLSKGIGYVGPLIDGYELFYVELSKAIKTDNWRPFFVKAETIMVGLVATSLVAFTFSVLAGGIVGLIGFALIMAGVSALVDEKLVEKFNSLIGV